MKVLIFGLGLNGGGVGSAQFFASKANQVKVTDLKPKKNLKPSIDELKNFPQIEYHLGKHDYADIDWADLIIKNPAVKIGNPYVEYALKKGKRVEMDIGIFLQFVKPSQIIGITGTKGKSTTASLIYEVLKNAGKNVILAGNIGTSVLESISQITSNSLVVLELSSFQLESFEAHKVSPKWAVITNITPDHLNYYQSMDEYVAAKKIIGKYQAKDNFLFTRKSDPAVDQSNFLKGFKSKIIRFSKSDLPVDFKPHLLGEHNLQNLAAAMAVARTFNINREVALKILQNFKGIPFRMELIKTWHGVKIYNDTCATSPEASIQAIKTLSACLIHPPGVLILICGGMNKGIDYKKYAKFISENVKAVFFLAGDSTDLIRSYKQITNLRLCGLQAQTFGPYSDLEKLLKDVKAVVQRGDIVLFSPAATSFNLFQNEFDRGRKFNEAVQKVFK